MARIQIKDLVKTFGAYTATLTKGGFQTNKSTSIGPYQRRPYWSIGVRLEAKVRSDWRWR